MNYQDVAARVLSNIGGKDNVVSVMTCLTRLRVTLNDVAKANTDGLQALPNVLGVVSRNDNELEVVFGPSAIEGVSKEFCEQSGIELAGLALSDVNTMPKPSVALGSKNGAEHDEPRARAQHTTPETYTISAGHRQSYRAQQQAAIDDGRLVKEDIDALKEFLSSNGSVKPSKKTVTTGKSVLVINGPNLNMLGTREPDLYGKSDYAALVRICKAAAAEADFSSIRCFQSNHEGAIVDEIQCALGTYDGIVINPAAYTHTSVAILDAVKAVALPCVEVHISKVEEREDFRQVSYIRKACFETITGMGLEGYRKAILDLAEYLNKAQEN